MFCIKCGTKIGEGVLFCPVCGTRVDASGVPTNQGTAGNFPQQPEAAPQRNIQSERQFSSGGLFNMTVHAENASLKIFLDNNAGAITAIQGQGIMLKNLSPGTHNVTLKSFVSETSFEINLEKDTNLTANKNFWTSRINVDSKEAGLFIKKRVGFGLLHVAAIFFAIAVIALGIGSFM
jgi:hypothetical protein